MSDNKFFYEVIVMMRPEYPRPSLVREKWRNLNGEWDFLIDHGVSGKERRFFEKADFNMKINVPFAPESKLSGIENTDFMKSVWYKRTFVLDKNDFSGRIIIHFGAVDYLAEVWINGVSAGTHKGGYTPFSFDITPYCSQGENTLIVNAFDDTINPMQPTGKQATSYFNQGCVYTRTTGIWQTVWLEFVPDVYLKKLKLTPDIDNEKLYIVATFNKECKETFSAEAFLDGKSVAFTEHNINGKAIETSLDIKNPSLWSLDTPTLYDLKLKIGEDESQSYFGMRKVAINGYAIEINNKPVFQRLVLDQGFYPDGIYTAPTDEDLKNDIVLSKKAGFNGARLHMKVFEPRVKYWADKLGYLLWGEYPNWGLDTDNPSSLLAMLSEWVEAVERDYNSPSIVGWCPFNELGSAHRLADILETVYDVTKAIDPFRPMIDTSGYIHAKKTDSYDVHDYEQDPVKFAEHYESLVNGNGERFKNPKDMSQYADQPFFVSEFGGTWWKYDDNESGGWGYGKAPENVEEFYSRYEGLVSALLSNPKMCAFCYTQLTDLMQECNGIYSFSRKEKFDTARICAINSKKAAIEE